MAEAKAEKVAEKMGKPAEAKVAKKVEAPKVEAVKAAPVAPKEATPVGAPKMVEVTPVETFRCKYGKSWYNFEKGKAMKVPETMINDSLKGSGKIALTL